MTAVHVVTLLEEMPVQETTDAIEELTGLGLPVGTVIVNATRPPLLAGTRITAANLRRGLGAAGLEVDRDTLAGLVAEANGYQTRVEVEAALRAELAALGRSVVELPILRDGVTREGLDLLAAVLAEA